MKNKLEKKSLADINSRGAAGSWLAAEMTRSALTTGVSMASMFAKKCKSTSAFTVPATAIKRTAINTTYRFSDGSQVKVNNDNRKISVLKTY